MHIRKAEIDDGGIETVRVFLIEKAIEFSAPVIQEKGNIFLKPNKDRIDIYCHLKDDPNDLEIQGSQIRHILEKIDAQQVLLVAKTTEHSQRILNGFMLSGFKLDSYKTSAKKTPLITLDTTPDDASQTFWEVNANILCRKLVAEPSNDLTPSKFVEIIKDGVKEHQALQLRILNRNDILQEKMLALHGVAQGSTQEPFVVCIEYNNAPKNSRPILLVGKGVTFDAGGISLKTEDDLAQIPMKIDMAGAAAVYSALLSAAATNLEINVVGILGLVENMPSGSAQKPSDIVRTRNGKTVEILSTDCEGRLVLADLIDYGVQYYDPREIVDIATLEIGTMHALYDVYAGLFSNSEDLAERLTKSGRDSCEPLWRLPLHKFYNEIIISDIADLQNRNSTTKFASGSTAAHFLENFVPPGLPWAHIDIAGVTIRSRQVSAVGKGISGFGARLLSRYLSLISAVDSPHQPFIDKNT